MKKLSKKIISIFLALIMTIPAVFVAPFAAEAEDAPSSAYWSILASTDFTGTTWSGSSDSYYTETSPRTAKGGNAIGWNVKYGTHSTNEVIVNSKGVNFNWVDDSNKYQGLMYMSSYNGQTSNTIFNGIDNFKIDLAFSFTGKAKCSTGYDLNSANAKDKDVPLIKLANDSGNKYNHNSKYITQNNYFTQTMWGERTISSTSYFVDGGKTETDGTTTGGKWAITTNDNNASSVLTANTTYHYVVYVADNMLGCYVTDDSGNLLINYNPIEIASFNLTPDVISSIYLGASEFNFWGKYDVENIAYKSIEIYKGVDTSTYDSSRDKFLYAYFTGDSDAGETMHYAISQDGINFEAVSGGTKVWNPSVNGATETYPAADSAPYSDSVAISNHVRDSYAFYGQDGKDYVIATDLNTNNGSWGSIQNSRFLVWKMDYFGDINDTRPWTIDTANLPGMDDIIGATSDSHKTVKKAWAPQVIWDADMGKYMLYWSVGADGINTQIYYTYTSDFKTDFTTVKRLLYPDFDGSGITNHIDADITYHNGLYYCYFKNEDSSGTGSKRIWYAVAPNANGPYTDYELIDTSYGAEGPQVYETGNGSYMLMIDGYGDHTYHMYSAGSPYEFDTSDETTSNVTSLTPRHGSIIRITDAEYQKLKKLRVGEELRYAWGTTGDYGHNSTQTDSTGNQYHVTWNPSASTTTTGDGTLTLTDSGMYTDLSTVQNFIASDVYTVTFYYKSNGSTTRDDNHSIFSISRSDAVSNYVRLSTNGKFLVNNAVVTPSGNCSDGTTTRAAKFNSAVTDTTNSHRYTVTSDGLVTSLIIDGEYICGVINGTDIPNTLWITFGWARIDGVENNRLTAQFGQIVFKNVATDTGKLDEIFDEVIPANLTAGTFNAVVYHEDSACTGGYSNVVWCPKNMSWSGNSSAGGNSDSNVQYTNSKIAQQRQAVLVYDGAHDVCMPVVYETYCEASHSNKTDYVSSNGSVMKLTGNWTGYQDGNYQNWPGSSSGTSIGYDDSHTSEYSFNNTKTHRFFWNKLYYTGSGDTTNYYENQGNLTFWSHNYKNYWGSGWNSVAMYSANNYYVINYEPVYNILNGTTKIPNTDNMTISQLFNNDATNRWMYTKESYTQALYAMKLLKDCDPNNYNYSSDYETAAKNCAADIKKAVEAFNNINLVKNKFNITYRMADGSTKAEVVTAGNNLANVPDQTTAFHITDTNTHKKNCSWTSVSAEAVPSGSPAYNPSVTPSTSVMPKANTIYTETAATTETCEIQHVAANGDVNGYNRYECSICDETNDDYRMWDSQTWTTYNTNYTEYEGIVGDADYASTYTTSSKNTYETTVGNNSLDISDQSISQSRINTNAGAILSAKSNLDPVADITTLEDAYAEGDELLDSLVGKAAQYDSTSVSALITAVEAANASKFIGATPEEKANFGTKGESSDQNAADALAENITDAIAGLTIAEIKDGDVTVDTDAFEAAVNALNKLDPDAYEEDELNSLAAAKLTVNSNYGTATLPYDEQSINVVNGITTQAKADAAASVVQTALNKCIKRYTVTRTGFSSFGINNGDEEDGKINYGATLTCDSSSAETAWFLEIQTGSMHKELAFQGYGRSLKTKVLGTTTVQAVKRDETNSCKIMITRNYGDDRAPVQYANFVPSGTSFTLPAALSIAFYHFDGYRYKNGADINTSSITITGDTEIVAVYSQNDMLSCSVNAKNISGAAIPTSSVKYNEKVELDGGEGTYGWVEKIGTTYRPFCKGRTVSFFATEPIELEAANEERFNSYGSVPCVNLRQSGTVTADSKTVFNAQLVPGDADIREYGILIAAPSSNGGYSPITPADSQIVIENSGQQQGYAVLRAKSTKLVGANQFSIVVSGALPEGYKYRGYVIYQYKGSLKTVYSDIMQ